MSTLLMRLAAPMQAWGVEAKFDRRSTERAPTKSGIVGLIAAALGRRRCDPIDDIAALRFGVRTDREGVLVRDYHTAKSLKSAYVTNRYYLSDAVFLVGLEGDEAFLSEIDAALKRPAFPLFLGRRSCPPSGRVTLGIRAGLTLEEALSTECALTDAGARAKEASAIRLRIVTDATDGEQSYFLRDVPLSFSQQRRRYGFRRVKEYTVPRFAQPNAGKPTTHDAMAGLEE